MNRLLHERSLPTGQSVRLIRGDITQEAVDAIVNAANEHLLHGGGVAGVISRAGGPAIQDESNAWVRTHGPVSHVSPAVTGAGNLPCRFVIHAVGPVWGSGEEDNKLAAAMKGVLEKADEMSLSSISVPAISTGIFGFPKGRAACVLFRTVEAYFSSHPQSKIRDVRFVVYDQPTVDAFETEFLRW